MGRLLSYAMRLDLFDNIQLLDEARNNLVASVRTLKASSLLFDGDGGDHREYFTGGSLRLLFLDADDKKTVSLRERLHPSILIIDL